MRNVAKLLAAMIKKLARLLGLGRDTGSEPSKRKKDVKGSPYPDAESGGNPLSLSLRVKSRESFVRVVHRGGREELYPRGVSACQLMEKYPGNRVAKQDIFKSPHDSILWPEEELVLGEKYLMIPSATVRKLQEKNPEKPDESSEWDSIVMDLGGMDFEESVFLAKEFFVSKERSPESLPRKKGLVRKKKPFVPPLPKARLHRDLGWEPSLSSVQELSP